MIAWYKTIELCIIFIVLCAIWILESKKENTKHIPSDRSRSKSRNRKERVSFSQAKHCLEGDVETILKQHVFDCREAGLLLNEDDMVKITINGYEKLHRDDELHPDSDTSDAKLEWFSADEGETELKSFKTQIDKQTSEIAYHKDVLKGLYDATERAVSAKHASRKVHKVVKPSRSSAVLKNHKNTTTSLEVRILKDDSIVGYALKTWSVHRAISKLKDSLSVPNFQSLDLFWNEGLLSSEGRLKQCCGMNWLYVIRRPKHRIANYRYLTEEPDMTDPFEDEESRVGMSCGHAITPANLYNYCWTKIKDGNIDVTCPAVPNQKHANKQCGKHWDFHEISTKACLSDDERCLFQVVLFNNWRGRHKDVAKCPECGIFIQSTCNTKGYFFCKICGNQYCKKCYRPWKNIYLGKCDDKECRESLETLQLQLKTSGVKTIVGVTGCPNVRACPKCQTIIQHDVDACKHMDCPNKTCRIQFCFVCLAVKEDEYYWPDSCLGAFYPCKLAPIQNVM